MNTITRTLSIAALITAATTASAARGPEFGASSAQKNAPVVQDQSYGVSEAKHSGRHAHRDGEISTNVASSKGKASSQMSSANWNFQSYR